jgi:hypothetical protein
MCVGRNNLNCYSYCMNTNKKILAAIIFCFFIFAGQPAFAQLHMPTTTNIGIEAQVRTVFNDAPNMVAIAQCESGFRQYGNDGLPLRGGNGNYIGVFQFSETGHAATAKLKGFDIYETNGNIGYAKYVYDRQGTNPWIGCVKNPAAIPVIMPVITPAPTSTSTPIVIPPPNPTPVNPTSTTTSLSALITSNLQMGMAGPQVLALQQLLNASGFTIATSGPGSPGNETNQFGKLTREAVMRVQCSRMSLCSGIESTTGYGRVGPQTRAYLQKM